MPALTFRNFSVYSQGKRWGLASKASIDLTLDGGEAFFEKGEFIGSSSHVVKSALTLDSFVPTTDTKEQKHVLDSLMVGKYVDITCGKIGERFFKWRHMRVRSVKLDTDMSRGGLIMNVALEGGAPDIQKSTPALPLRLALF